MCLACADQGADGAVVARAWSVDGQRGGDEARGAADEAKAAGGGDVRRDSWKTVDM